MLAVEVVLALRLLAILLDRREVDRLQPLDAGFELVEGLLPGLGRGVLGQVVEQRLRLQLGSRNRLQQALSLQRQRLLVQALARQPLAQQQGALIELLAALLVVAQFALDAVDR